MSGTPYTLESAKDLLTLNSDVGKLVIFMPAT